MLQLSAPLYGTVMGLPGCPLLAIPSALIGSSQPLQPPHLWCSMRNFKLHISKPFASLSRRSGHQLHCPHANAVYSNYMEAAGSIISYHPLPVGGSHHTAHL